MATLAASLERPHPTRPDALARVSRALAFRFDILPLSLEGGVLRVAVADVDDAGVLDALRRATRLKIDPTPLARTIIRERLQRAYAADSADPAFGERRGAEAPAVRAVDTLLAAAVAAHASDVHVEPSHSGGTVRVRIDGVLAAFESISADLFPAFVSRIKLQAGMDIADKRQPQDGRFTVAVDGREIDARVSSMPTIDGEKLVIRLLDLHSQACDLGALGMRAGLLATFTELVGRPWGFIVVTGPTGSGKTTTLYASLAALDSATKSICSVEDPVELRVRGVTQVGVNPRAGLTFAGALRSFMRQDPNVIMVGEMRDAETAAVAISASLAGQLVLTTLHSNDAPRTVERLAELGVARRSLAAGLTGILAQRLVRRLCDNCRRSTRIPEPIRARWALEADTWWEPGACRACGQTGYSGRIGVFELLAVDDALREAIGGGASSVALAQIGVRGGYRPMFSAGIDTVLAGATSFAELCRVVGPGPDR